MAIVTVAVAGSFTVLAGILFMSIQLVVLQKIKCEHQTLVNSAASAPEAVNFHSSGISGEMDDTVYELEH
ncbi:hypothetical protein EYZ11_012357 [Aspergillus tanneri]|uniref:Uncharacterized protein n=1 Tax=Aspergillus tanneri TaxID=1220188 RepID=A0A4S3J2J5_9EURO|nr:hypothetical protein EYZ11_012357 [Aspergillus tanneri]